jgi:hypothetical protein
MAIEGRGRWASKGHRLRASKHPEPGGAVAIAFPRKGRWANAPNCSVLVLRFARQRRARIVMEPPGGPDVSVPEERRHWLLVAASRISAL